MNKEEFLSVAQKYWTSDKLKKIIGTKKYAITPITAPYLLRILGILNADSSISPNNMHKFIQINHMFNLIEPHISDLRNRHTQLNILDAGCGKSYLTFLLAWFLNPARLKQDLDKKLHIYGVDNNGKLVKDCIEKSKQLEFDSFLHFEAQSLLNLQWEQIQKSNNSDVVRPHCVISLHACDTATDMALAFAVKQKTDFIAVAPCCQAELARIWKENPISTHPLSPVFHSPQLRREIAAQFTDTLRVCLMRAHGYEVTCTEFVESSHTPKNRLITCVRRGNYLTSAQKEYEDLKNYLGGHSIMLENLLNTACFSQ